MLEILNTVWLGLLVLIALGFVLGVWVAIGLWHALASREPETRETTIFYGSDYE